MRDVPGQAHLDTRATTTAQVLRIAPKSGPVIGLAAMNASIEVDDGQGAVNYLSPAGFDEMAHAATSGQGVDNSEANVLVAPTDEWGITEEMVNSGYLDGAKWHVYLVNWSDATVVTLIGYGFLGQCKIKNGALVVPELRSLSQVAKQKALCQPGSKTCRATDGDPTTGCGRTPNTGSGTVITTAGETDRVFTTAASVPYPGAVTFTSGANSGRQFFVESSDGGVVSLRFPTPFPIEDGATFDFRDWCPGSIEACIAYGQVHNFRGEPYRLESVGDALVTPGGSV